jgi:hypothetical protein
LRHTNKVRPYHDPTVVTDDDWKSIRAVIARLGMPPAWAETQDFENNIVRLFVSTGKNAASLFVIAALAATHPRLSKYLLALSGRSSAIGGILTAPRIFLAPLLDQEAAAVEPPERYAPMSGYTPAYHPEPLDLTEPRFADRFFYEWQTDDGSVDEAAIDRALAAVTPDIVAIGSGPACSAALTSIFDARPNTRALVFDLGDYYRQRDYDGRTPQAACFETYRKGGAMPILNGPTRVTVNFVPQVWGGGAEIFSGTAHPLADWYLDRMPMTHEELKRHEARVRLDCRISRTPWEILNDGQKRYYSAAEALGYKPYLLEGFGRGGDPGNGRCYAGKKERIPYLDNLFRKDVALVGLANCRIDTVLREPDGTVAALELSFVSRSSRQVIATRLFELPKKCRVLLGASSMGDQRILAASGDPIALSGHAGVLHQYTCEVAALFDEPLSANGIPQGIGVPIAPDEHKDGDVVRRITIEGAHPGRPLLASLGVPFASERMKTWQATPRIATMGPLFTESRPGVQITQNGDRELTLQRLTKDDFERAAMATEAALRIWVKAGARGLCLNTPARFSSKDKELDALGFVSPSELDAYLQFCRKHPPVMQVFYRTGHRFGTVDAASGEVRGFKGLHLVGEDVIPPGPGVNPTLGILMLAHHYGEAVAERMP